MSVIQQVAERGHGLRLKGEGRMEVDVDNVRSAHLCLFQRRLEVGQPEIGYRFRAEMVPPETLKDGDVEKAFRAALLVVIPVWRVRLGEPR